MEITIPDKLSAEEINAASATFDHWVKKEFPGSHFPSHATLQLMLLTWLASTLQEKQHRAALTTALWEVTKAVDRPDTFNNVRFRVKSIIHPVLFPKEPHEQPT